MKKISILFIFLMLTGCGAPRWIYEDVKPLIGSPLPMAVKIDGVPMIKQDYNGCTPASLAMVFGYYGRNINQQTISRHLQEAYGSSVKAIEPYVRSQGFLTYEFFDSRKGKAEIKTLLASKFPVIVAGQARMENENHMLVLVGYDQNKATFVVHDPSLTGILGYIAYDRFNEFHSAQSQYIKFYGLVMKPKN